jgi:hypothetical protein
MPAIKRLRDAENYYVSYSMSLALDGKGLQSQPSHHIKLKRKKENGPS